MNENDGSSMTIKKLDKEPYIHLENGEELAGWGKTEEVIYNQQLRQIAKLEFYRNAFDFLYAHKIMGDYFEFGCHKVRTFRMALTEARKKNMHNMTFYAFDSFDGLPDNGYTPSYNSDYYAPRQLTTSLEDFRGIIKEHGVYPDRVIPIEGFYEDTLDDENKNSFKQKGVKAALITLDCSLYKSFVLAFDFIEDFLQEGTMIYIDDYRVTCYGSPVQGAPKAFDEFKKKSAFKFEPFLDIGWFGKSFFVYK